MNAHTPGPWRAYGHADAPVWSISEDGEKSPLANVLNRNMAANAALIACAPELLAALERLERGVRLWVSVGVSDDDMTAARAAIAKAKGQP